MAKRFGLIAAALLFIASMVSAEETEVVWLSGQGRDDPTPWEFFCTGGRNSGQWTTIGVPSNWELQGFGTYNYGHDKNKGDEQGRYRRTFTVPQGWAEKRVFIVFDGVMTDTEVSINGKSAGPKHQGGFYRFKYEITDLIKPGENLLEVTVSKVSSDASVEDAERIADYWVFGGIYRPVRLEAVPKQFIEWIAVDAQANGDFRMDVHLSGSDDGDVIRAEITGPVGSPVRQAAEQVIEWSSVEGMPATPVEIGVNMGLFGIAGKNRSAPEAFQAEPFETKLQAGQTMATIETSATGCQPWSAETPYLYAVKVELRRGEQVVHSVTKRFGFRTIQVRPGDGIYVNGQKIILKGVCRHSFWPDSGRCLSPAISVADVKLIKEMNMNAVRMSHYPPDEHFLDACDELGLYVLDELAGWQKQPYNTEIGKKLVKEMVTRDVCHPSILFWDNGNEGGWNRDLDDQFALYDPQKRTVLHPWENFGGIDTDHYETYASTQKKLSGRTPFMPTEFLHGLYDGGLGAGLEDYWNLTLASPMGAGGFLWALLDEGVVRTDKNGQIDVDGNHAPDGIVGPYRQKEASFYTIKEIWSPIHIAAETLPPNANAVEVENRYDFTNLADCTFDVSLVKFPSPSDANDGHKILFRHAFPGPDIGPHAKGVLPLGLPENRSNADAVHLTASDPEGRQIWTWSWDIRQPDYYQREYAQRRTSADMGVEVNECRIRVYPNRLVLQFSPHTPQLQSVFVNGKSFAFSGGPRLIGAAAGKWELTTGVAGVSAVLDAKGDGPMKHVRWTVHPTGWARLEYEYAMEGEFDLFGVSFDYPESKMRSMRFLGEGPCRVWKNRLKGGVLDVWSNRYKNDVPGVTWDFPEFKGYYKDWRWVVFTTEEGTITMVNETPELFLGVYRPSDGPATANTKLNVPDTGIALLHGIPAIGTKFDKPEVLGPQSQKNQASGVYRGAVWFHFDTGSEN
ncbi:MAG: glycoside hydrolase family 2 TIM barrel-domain containing protein [Phycisphaerales bacterium]